MGSRLQMENYSNMAWSTTVILPEGGITFDNMEGPLRLDQLEELLPRETVTVRLRRLEEAIAPLQKLAKDAIVRNCAKTDEEGSWLDIPRTLQTELMVLRKDYKEIERRKVEPC